MAHGREKHAEVRACYVHERQPLAVAAERAGIGYETARAWKRKSKSAGDDWDLARSATRLAHGGLDTITMQVLEDFALLFQSTMESLKNKKNADPIEVAEAMSRLADAYTKTLKAAGNASPKLARLSVAMEVIEELSGYIKRVHPGQLPAFVQILDPFAKVLSEKFG